MRANDIEGRVQPKTPLITWGTSITLPEWAAHPSSNSEFGTKKLVDSAKLNRRFSLETMSFGLNDHLNLENCQLTTFAST